MSVANQLARATAESLLRRRIDERSAACVVVGLGFIGSTMLKALAAAGFRSSGVDRARSAVELFASQHTRIPVSDDPSALASADIVVVAVRVGPVPGGAVDLEPLHAIAATLAVLPVRPRLVVLVSTVPPGTTRALTNRFLPSEQAFVVHAPERLQVDDPAWTIDRIPHIVGGIDAAATRLGTRFVATVADSVLGVATPEAAELAKLLENSSNAVGIALVAEVTRLAHALGIDMADVTAAAATKPFGYRPFHPGPGIGGHCIPNDVRMLRAAARSAQLPTRLLDATVEITEEMPTDTVDRLGGLLDATGTNLRGAEVLLVGLGFKVGTAETAATPARAVASELRRRGAVPLGVDSRVECLEVDGAPLEQVDHRSLGNGRRYAAAIVLSGDPEVAAASLRRSVDVVLDAGGGRLLDGSLGDAARL